MRFLRLFLLQLIALVAGPFVRPAPAELHRILYIKPDHLGDLLLATPVVAALREQLPNAQLTALVGPWSQIVFERNPHVDILLTCPFPGFERKAEVRHGAIETRGHGDTEKGRLRRFILQLSSFVAPYVTLFRYAVLLRATTYDVAIIGRDDHWWGAALALLAGIPIRIGFAVPECRPLLSEALFWDRSEHVTRQGLALAERIRRRKDTEKGRRGEAETRRSGDTEKGREDKPPAFDLPHPTSHTSNPTSFTPAPADVAWADHWSAAHLKPGERLVVLHPGTGGEAKHWLDERWAAVADTIAAMPYTRIVLTGGPGEEARVANIQANMHSMALNLAGQTSFGQLAALMAQARLVFGVDSGPLHLAAAVGVQTIHLYGPGDQQRFGPWGDPAKHVVLHTELWCRPCGVFSACPRGLVVPECMDRLTVGAVERLSVEALER